MRARLARSVLFALLAAGGCRDGGRQEATPSSAAPVPTTSAPTARPGRSASVPAQVDSSLAARGLRLNDGARLATYAAAGFEVYWPTGCGQLQIGEPDQIDDAVRQEFMYACDRFKKKGRGCSVYARRNDVDENGGPPSPPMVVKLVEAALDQYGVRVERQRPIEAPGMAGVEVQAVQPTGKGEVWIRGWLVGPHIYMLSAWNTEGGLFEDPEIHDFFASFKLL
jgi:hypothetical protein